jgi:hypothetical protein
MPISILGNIYLEMKNIGLALQCFHITNNRELSPITRVAERDVIQKQTKIAREDARQLVQLLDTVLPQHLHRLKIAFLRVEARLDATDQLQQLSICTKELRSKKATLEATSDEIQKCMQNS